MSRIPDTARTLVRSRAHHRCERCGAPAPNGQWHHRRSRRVVDDHTHCPCNGVWLCGTCHRWAHANPTAARPTGFIVSQWVTIPRMVPVITSWGIRTHECEGTFAFLADR